MSITHDATTEQITVLFLVELLVSQTNSTYAGVSINKLTHKYFDKRK